MQIDAAPVTKATLTTDFRRPRFCLLGVAFDQVDMPEVVERLGRAAREGTRLVMSTPNVNNIVAMQSNAGFRDAVGRCELVVPDGMPLVWMARLLGIRTRRVAGSDLFQLLMDGAAGPLRVFFFGGPEGVAATASERLNRDGGPMRGAGAHYPGFGTVAEMGAPAVVDAINATAPDFVVVALGTAKGQQWIEHVGPRLNAPLVSHLGAVVNFVAGSVRRAPLWMQDWGFEWVWRIREEPALWRRYVKDGQVLARLFLGKVLPLAARRLVQTVVPVRSSAQVTWTATQSDGTRRLTLAGHWHAADLPRLQDTLNSLTAAQEPLSVDCSKLGWVDQGLVALLIVLRGHQHKQGQGFALLNASPLFAKQLRWHCAGYLMSAT